MIVANPTATRTFAGPLAAPAWTDAPIAALRRVYRAWIAHRRLQAWNRDLPRPAGCGWVPARVWRRHSAVLTLRAKIAGTRRP